MADGGEVMPRFSQELFDAICHRIAEGESLRSVCASPDMPTRHAFDLWVANDSALLDQYARARVDREDAIFEQCFAIADSQEGDVIEVDGRMVTNHDQIARAKLRIDTRKWALSKMAPKKYGDKLDLNHSGEFNVIMSDEDSKL